MKRYLVLHCDKDLGIFDLRYASHHRFMRDRDYDKEPLTIDNWHNMGERSTGYLRTGLVIDYADTQEEAIRLCRMENLLDG
ncbi:hypothetical protein [Vibrio phage PJN101]|nr:hypothetical protein [Vibrio phage PJN101]